ncbi:hypothetical protein FVEN_g13116 [Fusarium venenatum]|nr:hypothetical protein FVEN_g13116 [Fusarium venenatum]
MYSTVCTYPCLVHLVYPYVRTFASKSHVWFNLFLLHLTARLYPY